MTRQQFEKLEKYMKSCMEKVRHDTEHIYRVLYTALEIAKFEKNVDKDILIASCLLHDIGKEHELKSSEIRHAKVGAKMARFFLVSNGWNRSKVEDIVQCIESHSHNSDVKPHSIEAKILYDSDKIDNIGAIGVSKVLILQGKKNIPLYNIYPNGDFVEDKTDDKTSFIKTYLIYLKEIHKNMYTDYGKKIARERYHTTKIFYDKLLNELNHEYNTGKLELKKVFGEPIAQKGKNNYKWLESYILEKQGVYKDYNENWKWTRFLINKDMFAVLCKDLDGNDILNIKSSPEITNKLRKKYSEIKECSYLNKLHWNSIRLDGYISENDMKKIIDISYDFQLNLFKDKYIKE